MQNGYSICFNEWALDKSIKNELGLLNIISSLTAEKGYCYASNSYFSKLFDIPEETVSRKIKKLERKGYLIITYKKRGCEIVNRGIRIVYPNDYQESQSTVDENVNRTIDENVKDNNISVNKISNNISHKSKKFIPPTKDEVKKYCEENNLSIDIDRFFNYYGEDWKDRENRPVKNWKQRVRTWANNNYSRGSAIDRNGVDRVTAEDLKDINF